MDPQRWKLTKELFDQAVALPERDQAAFLERACAGDPALRHAIESMLEHDDGGEDDADFRDKIGHAATQMHEETEGQGDRLGPYRLVRELGRGGMGTVWLAVRSDDSYRKKVAIKLLRAAAGEEYRTRFLRERQILASLEHPHIARLLDGGTTESDVPYVVMEYVEGLPIDRYCKDHDLSIDERVRLVQTVCDAVQFAHQNLIVHRDIKPGNIIVDAEGKPTLLDFGIAKSLESARFDPSATDTQTGMHLLTLRYASPEQIRGYTITTASDVYSLGVLLYELLTGGSPYDGTPEDVVKRSQMICVDMPKAPSAVMRDSQPAAAREVAGDLDNIILKAMDKEPARRYSSAGTLAEDLERHRKKLPVEARPATLGYQIGRFYSRHRLGVTAGVVALLAMIAATIFSAEQMRRALDAREQMDRERQVAVTQARRATLEAAAAHLEAERSNDARRMLESVAVDDRDWAWRHLESLLDTAIAQIEMGSPLAIGVVEDGSRVMSVEGEGQLVVWNPFSGEATHRYVLDSTIAHADIDAGATRLLTVGGEPATQLSLREITATSQPKILLELDLPEPAVDITLSADGTHYAVASATRTSIWNQATSRLTTWEHSADPREIKLSPNGEYLTRVGHDGVVRVFDLAARQPLDSAAGAAIAVIAADTQLMAEGRAGGGVRIRSLPTGRSVTQFLGHRGAVHSLAFGPLDEWLVSGGEDRTVRVWDTRLQFKPTVYSGHTAPIDRVAFSQDGRRILSLDSGGQARLWELAAEPSRLVLRGFPRQALALDYSEECARLALGSSRGHLSFWDTQSHQLYDRVLLHPYSMSAFAAATDCVQLATAHNGGVVLRSMSDPTNGRALQEMSGEVVDLAFTAEGDRLAALDETGRLRVWDTNSTQIAFEATTDAAGTDGNLSFNRNGSLLASSHEGRVVLWDTDSGEALCEIQSAGSAHGLSFSPTGDRLATGWSDGLVRIIAVDACAVQAELAGQAAPIHAIAYAPNGARLATGAQDGTIAIRDPERESIRFLFRARSAVHDLVYSGDGETLYSAEDGVHVRSTTPVRGFWADGIRTRREAEEGEQLFQRLFASPIELNQALAQIRSDEQGSEGVRRAALHLAMEPPTIDAGSRRPAGGTALHFPDETSQVVVENSSDLANGERFTVEAWVRPDRQPAPWGKNVIAAGGWHDSGRYVFSKAASFLFTLDHMGTIRWFVFTENGWGPAMNTRHRAIPDRWTHLALVRDGLTIRIFVNGHLVQQEVIANLGSASVDRDDFVIGGRLKSATPLHGSIDQVRVWNAARTADEIRETMSTALSAGTPGLEAAWRFDSGRGDTAFDTLGRHPGRMVNVVWETGR